MHNELCRQTAAPSVSFFKFYSHSGGVEVTVGMFGNSYTCTEHAGEQPAHSLLQRDPTSPMLFSLAIDELLGDLDITGDCFSFLRSQYGPTALLSLMSYSFRATAEQKLRATYCCLTAFLCITESLNLQKCNLLRFCNMPQYPSVNISTVFVFYLDPVPPATFLPIFSASEFCVLMGKSSLPLDGGTTRLQEPWCSLIQHVRHNSKLSRRLR
ncbi:hypothetical protein M513_00692 [Trichuris suis]|uniref:Uncharacterized protein n=1 Tax=Trichuris suis TaxID=68888 RepID=A0A085MMM0_9BILA|nr:hypothetical protein M513_00692 [Trichuris suis]